MTEEDKITLNSWERNILRKAHGLVTQQEVWKLRTSQELGKLYKTPDLVAGIKRRRWEWLGHVI
jgi:hypothetical protein